MQRILICLTGLLLLATTFTAHGQPQVACPIAPEERNQRCARVSDEIQTHQRDIESAENQLNTRGTFVCVQKCLPYLQKAVNPHVLMLSPPLTMEARWFGPHVAYTMAKYGMSMCVLGMAEEFKAAGIAFNALWPRTAVATAAVRNLLGGEEAVACSRKPEIVADAAYAVLCRDSRSCTGRFLIDEDVLREEGVTDLQTYQVDPDMAPEKLMPDFFL